MPGTRDLVTWLPLAVTTITKPGNSSVKDPNGQACWAHVKLEVSGSTLIFITDIYSFKFMQDKGVTVLEFGEQSLNQNLYQGSFCIESMPYLMVRYFTFQEAT